jgi:hypothetical protein
LGYTTNCHPNFEFSWGTSSKIDFFKMNIFHNAGVVGVMNNLFIKSNYINEYPYNVDLTIDENMASYFYWQQIQKTAKKSVLL